LEKGKILHDTFCIYLPQGTK